MRFRRAILIPLVFVLGCQEKKPDAPSSPTATATPAPVDTTVASATPTPKEPPLDGTLNGQSFRPQDVTIEDMKEGPLLIFRQNAGEPGSSIQIQLPLPEGAHLGNRDWTFGRKADDPVLILSPPGQKDLITVAGPDYTMTLRLTKHTRDAVEGVVDLIVQKPAGTALKGAFRAAYHRSPTGPLGADDAPLVHGKIVVKGAKAVEKLAAGYVGDGADGQPRFNETGYPVQMGEPGYSPAASPQDPAQQSWLASTADGVTYRHLNVPPGDYLVYVRRDAVMSAWKRVKLKAGDQQTIDLTIDPATTGEVVVTLPESDAKEPGETSLALVPAKADLPKLGLGSEHYFNVATVKMGEKTVKVSGIPAGKYRAVRGSDEAEVEVIAGKSVAVTLVPAKK
jgi:hypothetical protein